MTLFNLILELGDEHPTGTSTPSITGLLPKCHDPIEPSFNDTDEPAHKDMPLR
jgi:hypothetical protein